MTLPASSAPAIPPSVPPAPSPLGKGTIGRQLVVRVVALVAAIAIALSAMTSFATYRMMLGQVDDRLDAAAGRYGRGPHHEPDDEGGPPSGGIGQDIGTIVFERVGSTVVSQGVLTESGFVDLPQEARAVLVMLDTGTDRVSVNLPALGVYRLQVGSRNGHVLIVGLALDEVTSALVSRLALEAGLVLLAIVVAVWAVRALVVRSLRPLNRLAATATHVSRLELERGEVELPVRVPDADANPVNEVGRVGAAFNLMLDNVEDALAARQRSETKVRRFVADASHELRNPLATIRGYAELTRRGRQELPSDAAHALNRIEAESDRMSALVEDLLLLARLDSGPALDLQPIDVTEVVLNAVTDAQVAGPDHVWKLSVPPDPLTGQADAHRLHQVVANLLANARSHTPPGTTVTTSVRSAGEWIEIDVHDDGPGVPPQIMDRIFERFTRADASRDRRAGSTSTGLGLAIVQAVMAAHGGSASVVSQPGDTTFRLRLPRLS